MNKLPRILGIIPARSGSKGIAGKNIKVLGNKPLIRYTIESALLSKCLTTIVLSSDSEAILKSAEPFGRIDTPFLRPKELALDNTPTIDVVRHALAYYESIGQSFDYVCLLQPTSPFRSIDLIDRTIKKIVELQGDSLTTVRTVPHRYNPQWTFKMDQDILALTTGESQIISRRQDLPDAWYRDGKIYIASVNLVKTGTLLGGKIIGFENDHEPDINIDTPKDWELAEKFLENGHKF